MANDWEKYEKNANSIEKEPIGAELDAEDIKLLTNYGRAPYEAEIKTLEKDVKMICGSIIKKIGIKDTNTGLARPTLWNLNADREKYKYASTLQIALCKQIIKHPTYGELYSISLEFVGKYIVERHHSIAEGMIEPGSRVAVDREKFKIQMVLPTKIDSTVTLMQIEERPDVTYASIGGCKDQIEKLREVVELPLLNPDKFAVLGVDPPRGVLLYGPPGTGKTLCARAVANSTGSAFIRVIGSELVQRYIGEGAKMVREIFKFAKSKGSCIVFFDEIDAIGGTRFDDGHGSGDSEVQRTMLELIYQLDGFDARGNIKVLMATNRPDTLDPALMRPGRLDRKVEFSLPDLQGRETILKIHSKCMSISKPIRFDLIARMCPNSTGAELRSVCTEAGMFAIRARRKAATEQDFLDAVKKVIKSYARFSSTPKYMTHN